MLPEQAWCSLVDYLSRQGNGSSECAVPATGESSDGYERPKFSAALLAESLKVAEFWHPEPTSFLSHSYSSAVHWLKCTAEICWILSTNATT